MSGGQGDRPAGPGSAPARCGGAILILVAGLSAAPGRAQAAGPPPGTQAHATPSATGPGRSADSLAKADAAEAEEAAREEILVTGHPQRGAVATEIPPEVVLNATAIHALGAADLNEVFAELAPEIGPTPSGSGGAAGAAGSGGSGGAGGTSGGPAAPIILVNGQRIAGFSSIKDLPPEAVRRLEIFPEQVALAYGYGPGQRVVNVVLRSNYRALTVLGRYTAAPENWRGLYRAKVDLVRIGETAHWNVGLDLRHQDALFAGSTLAASAAGDGIVPAHTLAAQNDHLTVSGGVTRPIGALSAAFTANLELDTLQSRPGLSDEDGGILAQQGLSDLVTGPLGRIDQTVEAQANLTLNGRAGGAGRRGGNGAPDGWRWSFIGRLDDTARLTRTTDAVAAGGLDPVLLPSPGLIGRRCGTDPACVATETRTAGGDLYLNGPLFSLPAGPVTAALRTGFAFSGLHGASPIAPERRDLTRDEASAQANLVFPITTRGSALGRLAAGINGEAHPVSGFGTLGTLGSTLDWAPVRPISIQASLSRTEQAPSLLQLGMGALATPDLRAYDFVNDTTTIVRRTDGGTASLRPERSRTATVRLQVNPVRTADLALSAELRIDHVRDPIASLSAATVATIAAFPGRFTSTQGYLTAIDVSPVNLTRRDRSQIRWGLNYSTAFGRAQPAADGTRPPTRDQFQIALYDDWRLRDAIVLRPGSSPLDLLGNDIISDAGGTPTHQIELQTTVSTGPWSADISAAWQTPTHALAGPLQDRLTFSQGITLNLKLQINLADQHWLVRRIPWLRGSLNLSADNLLGAHTNVRDASGLTPAAYREDYLNPTGRTFRITLRKRFH